LVAASIFAARWTLIPRCTAISNGTTSLRSRGIADRFCFVNTAKCAATQTLITPGYHNLVPSSRILLDYTSLSPANIFLLFHFHYLPHLSRRLQSVSFISSSFFFSSVDATHLVFFYRVQFSFLSFSNFL